MANYLKDQIASIKSGADLDGKILVAETKSFTFPHNDAGKHGFIIKKVDADYAIYELVPNADHTNVEASAEPVILTSGKDIFFNVRRNLAPYMDKKFQQKTVADDEVFEQQLLAAFIAYASSRFSMGNYNIQLVDDLSSDEALVADGGKATTTTTTSTTAKPTTTTTTSTTTVAAAEAGE